jgi:hypothetical protein
MDPMASNLPMSVANSVILEESDLQVIAGEQTSFTLEIRTTDPSKRSNRWFENLKESVQLTFSGENVKYTLSQGTVKGRYVIQFTPTVAGQNVVSIKITGQDFTASVPKL